MKNDTKYLHIPNICSKFAPKLRRMRYHVAHIAMQFDEPWRQDVFEQALFDLGFDTIDGADCYIQSELWSAHKPEIEALCAATEGVNLLSVEACEDRNWNATWEAEHPVQELPLGVTIVPHCAFGAGHHETTAMMIDALLQTDLTGKNVLDHGTGTGVLAIFAKKRGAAQVTAVDIDEKSVQNAKENAELNHVDIDVQHSSIYDFKFMIYDLILANIHRNILLEHMPAYAQALQAGGELWISGFYEDDIPALHAAAEQNGLRLINIQKNNEWRMIQLKK